MVALPDPYESKVSGFIKMLSEVGDVVLVHHPEVLGDTYGELVESLNRLADSGKMLSIVPRNERKG